jgi:hypothetical protein
MRVARLAKKNTLSTLTVKVALCLPKHRKPVSLLDSITKELDVNLSFFTYSSNFCNKVLTSNRNLSNFWNSKYQKRHSPSI